MRTNYEAPRCVYSKEDNECDVNVEMWEETVASACGFEFNITS